MPTFGVKGERHVPPFPTLRGLDPRDRSELEEFFKKHFDANTGLPPKHGHTHLLSGRDPLGTPSGIPPGVALGGSGAYGSGPQYVPSGTTYTLGVGIPENIGAVNAEGAVDGLVARRGHVHGTPLTVQGGLLSLDDSLELAEIEPSSTNYDFLIVDPAELPFGMRWTSLAEQLAERFSFNTVGDTLVHGALGPEKLFGPGTFERLFVAPAGWGVTPGNMYYEHGWSADNVFLDGASSSPAFTFATPYEILHSDPLLPTQEAISLTIDYFVVVYSSTPANDPQVERGTVKLLVYRPGAGGSPVVIVDPATSKVADGSYAQGGTTLTVDWSVTVGVGGEVAIFVEVNSDLPGAADPAVVMKIREVDWWWKLALSYDPAP